MYIFLIRKKPAIKYKHYKNKTKKKHTNYNLQYFSFLYFLFYAFVFSRSKRKKRKYFIFYTHHLFLAKKQQTFWNCCKKKKFLKTYIREWTLYEICDKFWIRFRLHLSIPVLLPFETLSPRRPNMTGLDPKSWEGSYWKFCSRADVSPVMGKFILLEDVSRVLLLLKSCFRLFLYSGD